MGRIKTYASAAEKMRAWAEVPPPPPVIVDKVVEKFVTVPDGEL